MVADGLVGHIAEIPDKGWKLVNMLQIMENIINVEL